MISLQRPEFSVFFILPLIILLFFIHSFSRKKRRAIYLLGRRKAENQKLSTLGNIFPEIVIIFALLFIIISLLGPKWGIESIKRRQKGINIYFLLDNSKSMLAEDIYPSRLEKSKSIILKLAEGFYNNDSISLITFSGDLQFIVPPTIDFEAFSNFLLEINPQVNSTQGSYFGKALKNFYQLIKKDPKRSFIIIITDGETFDNNWEGYYNKLKGMGSDLYIVGIGSPQGAPIPIKDDKGKIVGWLKDNKGETVISNLNLYLILKFTGNSKNYSIVKSSSVEVEKITKKIKKSIQKYKKENFLIYYSDQFRLPLIIGFLLLIIYQVFYYEKK